eukprot:gene7784-975_t
MLRRLVQSLASSAKLPNAATAATETQLGSSIWHEVVQDGLAPGEAGIEG